MGLGPELSKEDRGRRGGGGGKGGEAERLSVSLTASAVGPAASRFCCVEFPTLMACAIKW